jgi:8-oxo-dGTP pyrophosphatase MutT (NUDIX family)
MARSGYVARVREKIGSDLLTLASVSVFIFDPGGRFLLAQQNGHDNWLTIGGGVEPEDTPADAVVREAWEEIGVLVRPTRILGVFGGPDFHITYGNGDVVAYTSIGFEAELVSGNPMPDGDELRNLAWVSLSDLPKLKMLPGMRYLIESCVKSRQSQAAFAPPAWAPPK